MKQVDVFKWGLVLMLILNLVLIAFLIFGRPEHHPPRGVENKALVDKGIYLLHLNTEQESLFRVSAKAHHKAIHKIVQEQKPLLRDYFQTITHSNNIIKDSLFQRLQYLEGQKMEVTYAHFEEIKKSLKADQIPALEDFILRLQANFFIQKNNNPKKPKDF